MLRRLLPALVLAAFGATATVQAADGETQARVLSSTPVYRVTAQPCRERSAQFLPPDSRPGLHGAAKMQILTVVPVSPTTACGQAGTVSPDTAEIVGYDVRYRYRDHTYQTRMPYDPGERLPVRVDVRAGRD